MDGRIRREYSWITGKERKSCWHHRLLEHLGCNGKSVYSAVLHAVNEESIETSKLTNGVYFIRVSEEGKKIQTQKLVIAH